MWALWSHDAVTGDEVEQAWPTENVQWSMNLTGTGTCSFAFRIDDAETGMLRDDIDRLFTPNARLLGLRWGDTVLGAWKVTEWDYADDGATVTVTGVEIRAEMSWRLSYDPTNPSAGTLSVAARSASGAVRVILMRFLAFGAYPIDLPADGAGTVTETWEYWKKLTCADLLKQIEDLGYEVLFRPYLTPGRQLRFETIVATKVRLGVIYFHLQAEDTPLSGVGYKLSGTEQITAGQGLGSGTGQDQQVSAASGSASWMPIPPRHSKRSFDDMTGAQLVAATTAWVSEALNPIGQWRVDAFTVTDNNPASDANVGRGWSLESKGHRVWPDGRHEVRVIACSGAASSQIKVEVQNAA